MKEEIERALEVLRSGGVILYPTDTIWGLGADATDEEAIQKIRELKGRDSDKPMSVLVSDERMLQKITEVPALAWDILDLSDKPVTIVYESAEGVAKSLCGKEGSLGIRLVKNPFCIRLIQRLGRPLVTTSANVSGMPSPAVFSEISDEIKSGVDFIADPALEKEATGAPSSILMIKKNGEVKVLRT